MTAVRVVLPTHLQKLADVEREVTVEVTEPLTVARVLDALEARHPTLRGTIREHGTGQRRAYMRLFGGGEDLSLDSLDRPLPESVASGRDPLRVVGAIAGG